MEVNWVVLEGSDCQGRFSWLVVQRFGILEGNDSSFSDVSVCIISLGSHVEHFSLRVEASLSGSQEVTPGSSREVEVSLVLSSVVTQVGNLKGISKHDVSGHVQGSIHIVVVFEEEGLVER